MSLTVAQCVATVVFLMDIEDFVFKKIMLALRPAMFILNCIFVLSHSLFLFHYLK